MKYVSNLDSEMLRLTPHASGSARGLALGTQCFGKTGSGKTTGPTGIVRALALANGRPCAVTANRAKVTDWQWLSAKARHSQGVAVFGVHGLVRAHSE